ncbi:MAG TPA: VWA domain-containing protein [Gemmataceae bacterium]|nr:VWA domain-containing protein [Gemmataceae bacterium]
MRLYLVALTILLLAALPLPAPAQGGVEYTIEVDGPIRSHVVNTPEKRGRYVTVCFKVLRNDTGAVVKQVPNIDKFVVYEDGRLVRQMEVEAPETGALTAVLALDISGSMATSNKIEEAKKAALNFLDRLHERADCGLILFDHQMRLTVPPARDPALQQGHREQLRGHITAAEPRGGTAYLDAAAEAVKLLDGIRGRRAVVVMTDGVDLNSKKTLDEVIELARSAEVLVYTLGVGEPGKSEPVTSVLVLDHSGSMLAKASRSDKLGKIGALKVAAARFVDILRPGARTTLLPFSDRPGRPDPFSDEKADLSVKAKLKRSIETLQAQGETALFDAVYDALMTLHVDAEEMRRAGKPVGRRAVVAMTDGKDNMSRRRVDQVIRLAKETGTPLYLLGLGAPHQIDEKTMRRMAEETGGKYYHAPDADRLIEIFEGLSIQLHDDGIDEASLRRLAEETGGKYLPVRDVTQLHLMYAQVAEELQSTYRITFPSWRPISDGTVSRVDIAVERGGVRVSNLAGGSYARHGVVAAQMHPGVYLALLLLLGGLLVLPGGVRRLYRGFSG